MISARLRLALTVSLALHASPAHADATVELAALVPAPDARNVLALGTHGEVYEPDSHGAWIRHRAGGLANPVTAATRAGDAVFALTAAGELFRLGADEWSTIVVGAPHAKAVLGAGPRALAASGRTVAALADQAAATAKHDAPATVLTVAAGAKAAAIETERGLARDDHGTWQPITGAPHHVAALLSDRFALADDDRGVVDSSSSRASRRGPPARTSTPPSPSTTSPSSPSPPTTPTSSCSPTAPAASRTSASPSTRRPCRSPS